MSRQHLRKLGAGIAVLGLLASTLAAPASASELRDPKFPDFPSFPTKCKMISPGVYACLQENPDPLPPELPTIPA